MRKTTNTRDFFVTISFSILMFLCMCLLVSTVFFFSVTIISIISIAINVLENEIFYSQTFLFMPYLS